MHIGSRIPIHSDTDEDLVNVIDRTHALPSIDSDDLTDPEVHYPTPDDYFDDPIDYTYTDEEIQ